MRTPAATPGPSAHWLRALHAGAAARDIAMSPPLLLHRPLPPAVALELGLAPNLGAAEAPASDGATAAAAAAADGAGAPPAVAAVGELRAWLRALEASADWAAWALDQG